MTVSRRCDHGCTGPWRDQQRRRTQAAQVEINLNILIWLKSDAFVTFGHDLWVHEWECVAFAPPSRGEPAIGCMCLDVFPRFYLVANMWIIPAWWCVWWWSGTTSSLQGWDLRISQFSRTFSLKSICWSACKASRYMQLQGATEDLFAIIASCWS